MQPFLSQVHLIHDSGLAKGQEHLPKTINQIKIFNAQNK